MKLAHAFAFIFMLAALVLFAVLMAGCVTRVYPTETIILREYLFLPAPAAEEEDDYCGEAWAFDCWYVPETGEPTGPI